MKELFYIWIMLGDRLPGLRSRNIGAVVARILLTVAIYPIALAMSIFAVLKLRLENSYLTAERFILNEKNAAFTEGREPFEERPKCLEQKGPFHDADDVCGAVGSQPKGAVK